MFTLSAAPSAAAIDFCTSTYNKADIDLFVIYCVLYPTEAIFQRLLLEYI